jgi:Winged helix DNA-binding domain
MMRQGLAVPMPAITEAVAAMGGAHAQVMSAAELSVGIRVADATPASIRAELAPGGSLVKTYGLRGTVHLLPRGELPLWCSALDAVPVSGSSPVSIGLDETGS